MRAHTKGFKDQLKELGREIDSRITYGENTISAEELFSVSPVLNADILKSVMKQLDFESSVQVPQYTVIKYELGLKVNGEYEYIDYGNYIVYSSEYNEDTQTYEHTCYDSMLFSMKDYVKLQNGSFPMTVREYLTNLCLDCGLVFKNVNDEFANYDKVIKSDLYANLGYTYRDIFDELAQVTASVICVDTNNLVEVRYITETNDTIDAEYLNSINVKFGTKYGPINTIVLSRSAESDNVYYPVILPEKPCEIKIKDNQIMNDNDRSDFLPDIYEKLNGLEYYINDYESKGILYYELYDKYNVKIGDNEYSCLMLNDEPKITQGISENIFTEIPEETTTDYTKADKTDRKINQTYLIVDKQNQTIKSVVSQTEKQNQKISEITQTVDEVNSKIKDIADITITGESNYAIVELDNINQSEPITIKIRPLGENVSYLYLNDNLFPSDNLYFKDRTLRFTNKTTGEVFDYELPNDLLYYDENNYDEFILEYDSQTVFINKKVGYNADGTTHILDNPYTIEYPYPKIELTDGDYIVDLLGYDNAYLFVRLMAQNIYTTQFATRAEVNSEISHTANKINSEINQKLSNYSTTTEMNNKITQEISKSESKINLEVNKKVNTSDYNGAKIMLLVNDDESSATINADKVNIEGVITAINNNTSTTIDGNRLTTGSITADKIETKSITSNQVASDIITTENFSAQEINANKITSGTIATSRLSSDVITTSNFSAQNINGEKITSGTISTDRLDSKVITTDNFSAQEINADNITSGTISTDRLSTNVITTSNFSAQNINGDKISGGTVSSASVDLYNGVGFLKMSLGDTYHPYVSALNVATQGASSNLGGISFRNVTGRYARGDEVARLACTGNGAFYQIANGTANYSSVGATGIDSGSYMRISSGNSGAAGTYSGSTYITANASITLSASSGAVYAAGNNLASARVQTLNGSASSRNTKENFVEFDNDKYENSLKLLENMHLYEYDYKYDLYKDKHQYGFILDEIEKLDKKQEFFKIHEEEAIVNDRHLNFNTEEKSDADEVIKVKMYDSNTLDKYLLTVCKALLNKVETLENRIKELESDKNE